MIRSLWIAKTGLETQQTSMDVISNNLANVNTTGFKRSRAVFEDLMYQTLRQPGASVGAANQLPSGLQSMGENLYAETDASGPANLLQ
ncbi:MAG: flagellar basal-body rod protein FlgG, partial [Rhizobiales bacterium]|nr:flagellar basal-body rod protein FlgG [Hyphomicrobiales bacterium]